MLIGIGLRNNLHPRQFHKAVPYAIIGYQVFVHLLKFLLFLG
jgi:hypothetical protein